MIQTFEGSDVERLQVVLAFRRRAFAASRRDPKFAEAWQSDAHDPHCRHLLMTDGAGSAIASVRMALDGRWPVEDRYRGPLDKAQGAEFGRLAVGRHIVDGKRTLYELMAFAGRQCIELGRPFMYGMTIAPFQAVLRKSGVPFTVISEPLVAYGETQNVILFDARELVAFHDIRRIRQIADSAQSGQERRT